MLRLRRALLLLAAVTPALLAQQPQQPGAGAKEHPSASERVAVGVRTDLASLYPIPYGPGLDVFLSVRHFPIAGSKVSTHLWPSIDRQVAYVMLSLPATRDRRFVAAAHAQVERNRNDLFYGAGPHSRRTDRVSFDRNGAEVEAKVGVQAGRGRILFQPVARYRIHRVLDVLETGTYGAWSRLQSDPSSAPSLPEFDRVDRGIAYGVELELDARDRRAGATRGMALQGSLTRFYSRSNDDLRFDRARLFFEAAIPFPGGHVVAFRAMTGITRNRGSAPVPYYDLLSVDQRVLPGYAWNRFAGHDLAVLNVEYRFPLAEWMRLYRIDLVVHAGAAGVYDSLPDQFKPALSFDHYPATVAGRTPLRPGGGLGIAMTSLANDRVLLHWLVGLSPEQASFGPLNFAFSAGLRLSPPTLR